VSGETTGLAGFPRVTTRLGFGCEQLGGYEWGEVDPRQIEAAIEVALERGVTLFDTADCYGRGESERRLGRVLAAHRGRAILATKFGVRFSDSRSVWYDSSPAWAQRALDESLARLNTDVIDLLQMHYWDGVTPVEQLFECLEKLRARGKIRWYGVTNHVPAQLVPQRYPGFVSASLEYSLLERRHEAAARDLAAAGLTFLAYGSLAQGMLSGKYGTGSTFAVGDRRARARYRNFHGERLVRNQRIVELLTAEASKLGATPAQVAIAWVLHALPASVALVGFKRVEQLRDALGALQLKLSAETVATLEAHSRPAELKDAATP
jgi:aryl-alcohol dehydrogenase-like predicted oxidoreductase